MTGKVYAVVLAAGQSSRFGGKKLTRNLGGKPLLQLPLAAAQAAFPGNVVLVAGHEADAIIESSGGLANHVVVNPDYSEGQGSSIAAGVRACRKDADAIAILLADQPLVTSEILERLAAEWTGDERHIVASGIGDSLGPPVLFGKGAFDKLCELDGDVGAKKLLQSGEFDVARIAVGAASFDVDTSQDLEVVSQLLATEK